MHYYYLIKTILINILSFTLLFTIQANNTYCNKFININIEDGLPHYTINDILQDTDGYIWIATNDGLVKNNSYNYKVFKSELNCNSGIAGQQVLRLFEDSQRKLWVGTNKALCLFNKSSEKITPFYFYNKIENFKEKVPVLVIKEYNDSTFLIGTDGGGLYMFNPKRKSYTQIKNISNLNTHNSYLRINDIQIDNQNNIWLASLNNGLLKFDIKTKNITQNKKSITAFSEIRSMTTTFNGNLLIGTYGNGLWEYNIQSDRLEKHIITSIAESISRVYTLKFIKNNEVLLIGTDGSGLIMYNIKQQTASQLVHMGYDPYSISNNVVKSILLDSENNLWLGHYKGGISFAHNRKPFYNIHHNPALPHSLSNNLVNSIIKDKNDNILVGTDGGGLNIIKPNGDIINSLNKKGSSNQNFYSKSILSLYKDKSDNIWVGTYLDGIYLIDPSTNKIKPFKKNSYLSSKDIRCFYENRDGDIWIGTNGGGINIYHPKNDSITYLLRDETDINKSISLNWIRCIFGDSYGFIWIGTAYGLNKYDPVNHSFTKYYHSADDKESLSNDFVYSVFEDANKDIWIGTSYGLNKYNRNEDNFTNLYAEHGLPNNIIYNITEDSKHNLWITTNKGISNFNVNRNIFYNYDLSDGLLSESFINGAMYNDMDSIIYIGSTKGLTYFKPTEIKSTYDKNPLVFTDFKIFNQSVNIGEKINNKVILKKHISQTNHITLSSKQNFISFEFTLLNYGNPNKTTYEYKLENFDEEWVKTDNNLRKAIYTDLKPGNYTFKVKTSNTFNTQEKSISLTITPSFYQSIWFKILIILTLIVPIYFWDRMRTLRIKSEKTMVEKKLMKKKLEYEKEQIALKNERLQYEMENKNAQLTSSALLISHKNDIMKGVKNKLMDFATNGSSHELNGELKHLITSINKEFKVEDDWKRFEEHFNHVHQGFFNKLKKEYNDLSTTNLKLSAYLMMDLTSKEIASLMNISVRGVEKARYRLRQKLDIPKGEKLTTFINNL